MSFPAGMETAAILVQPIEFEPSECANLRRESGDEFAEELV